MSFRRLISRICSRSRSITAQRLIAKRKPPQAWSFRQYSPAKLVLLCLLALLGAFATLKAQVPATMLDQMSTDDHLKQPGWWPRKGDASRNDYVGVAACAECHQTQAVGQDQHSMAHTSMLASQSSILKNSEVQFRLGRYSYKISRNGDKEIYSVTDGAHTFSAPLTWAFGSGSRGQSYLFDRDGRLWEARISFFHDRGFNITPDHPGGVPKALEFALGRPVPDDEQIKCFGCHMVASTTKGQFDPSHPMLGISCEGCHGPGAAHVALAQSGSATPGLIYNPARLTAVQSVDFCGACHRTWWDASLFSGVRTVRFPAFRLEKSKCWGNGDKRITCIACHNPHRPLDRDPAAYDDKCLSCHESKPPARRKVGTTPGDGLTHVAEKSVQTTSEQPSVPACPVATNKCVSCHMPKYEIPSMRNPFTDHKIQIVTSKEFRE
jgi:hypothetical protein